MSFNGLPKATIQLPFAAGLDTKSDPRAMQPPGLLVAKDIVFEETGGLQLRYPTVSVGNSIYPSGTLSNVRRAYAYGDELVAFTKDALYAWNPGQAKWVSRGTHLAVKATERSVFVTTGDQTECDRARLSNVVITTWTDGGVYCAAEDASTGAVLVGPTLIQAGSSRPRLVALTTKILLFKKSAAGFLNVIAIDPADPATGFASSPTNVLANASDYNDYYDVVRIASTDTAVGANRRDTTTSYSAWTVTAALSVTTATHARTCDGPIAVSAEPAGIYVQVVRTNGTDIEGDLLEVDSLTDDTVNSAIGTAGGTPMNQIAVCHRSTQDSGTYRAYVFWSSGEDGSGTGMFRTMYNWIGVNGSLGTAAVFVAQMGVASRAFDHEGRVFVNLAFGAESITDAVETERAQLQNTYYLYRDDELLVGKHAPTRAGGFSSTTSHLPHVQSLGSGAFAWCGVERRIIQVGPDEMHTGYSARAPREITITFDSNEARRVARLGQTLYVTGAELMQYDGRALAEVGFHTYPWYFALVNVAGSGSVEDGTYSYKATWRWDNAKGERDRCTTATTRQFTQTGGTPQGIQATTTHPIRATHKSGVVAEFWRTEKNPAEGADFYLITSQDPSTDGANPNGYRSIPAPDDESPVDAVDDALADATLTSKEGFYENNGVLENMAPPAATIIAATDERVFLAGVAGDPDRVWYSKLREDGFVTAFNEALTITVPKQGGDITALAVLNDTLVVFRETAIYQVPGDGFDNTGGGSNYGPARSVSHDVGAVSAEAVALTPGGLIFKSSKGWYVITSGGGLDYIGAPVADFDTDTVQAIHVIQAYHQVRVVTSSRVLMFDYLVGQWAEWTISDAVHAVIWNGTWHDVSSTAVRAEQTSYASNADAIDVTLGWIKPADLQGAVAIRRILILGEFRSAHDVHVEISYNYLDSVVDTKTWTATPTTVGGPLQVAIGPSRPKCQAMKLRIYATAVGSGSAPAGEALKLTGIAFEVGIRPGLHRRVPAAQKT